MFHCEPVAEHDVCGPARDTVLTNRQTEKLNFDANYITNSFKSSFKWTKLIFTVLKLLDFKVIPLKDKHTDRGITYLTPGGI
jgi:hypothetical protein